MKNTVKFLLISLIFLSGMSLKAQSFTPSVNTLGYIPYLEQNPLAVAQVYNVRMAVTLGFIANDLDSLSTRANKTLTSQNFNAIYGTSAAPTFTKDSAITKLATDTLSGTNISGKIAFTTTSTVRGGDSAIGEVAFVGGVTYPHGCSVSITPGNPNAAILTGTTATWIKVASTTGFTLAAGSLHLKASAHYIFYYTVIGN